VEQKGAFFVSDILCFIEFMAGGLSLSVMNFTFHDI